MSMCVSSFAQMARMHTQYYFVSVSGTQFLHGLEVFEFSKWNSKILAEKVQFKRHNEFSFYELLAKDGLTDETMQFMIKIQVPMHLNSKLELSHLGL